MEIKYGEGTSEYGPGVDIVLSGDELAQAIFDYIKSQGAIIEGPMTARANGGRCMSARVHVDPSGMVTTKEQGVMSGRGPSQSGDDDLSTL